MLRVWVITGGRAPPACKSAHAPCHGVARQVPCRVAGLGIRVPDPGGHDGLDALPRPLRAQDVNVPDPIREQAGPRRVRPVGPKAAPGTRRHRGTVPSIC